MRKLQFPILFSLVSVLGCASGSGRAQHPLVPAIEYSKMVNNGRTTGPNAHEVAQQHVDEVDGRSVQGSRRSAFPDDTVSNMNSYDQNNDPRAALDPKKANQLQPYGPPDLNPADYNGPLSLGDPGQTSSLWRETSTNQDFFRDVRAWQPMDLITILIDESTQGKKEAKTEIKGKSTIAAAIDSLFGFEHDFDKLKSGADSTSLLGANTQNDYKGEGKTDRKDSLTGNISAMVVEVLPSGILRIEGTKIISMNNEEQIMVMTGLIRSRDINSENEVNSSRIANMRIDYYGHGQVGDVQREGWLGRAMRTVWPF